MQVDEHGRAGRRRTGWRGGSGLVAALAAFGLGVVASVWLATPAGATDDGEDLSDLLVDDVDGYELQPKGDPTQGRSGPIDWEDMGGEVPGLGTDELPSQMATYVNTFFSDDYSMFALVMGLDIGDLDPSAVLAGAMVGMGHHGADQELTLPNADLAEVEYEARDVPDPLDDELTYSAAAMSDKDIVVLVMVSSWDGDIEEEHRVLDRFVTAQAQFEPPVDQTRSGGLGGSDEDEDEAASDDDQAAAASDDNDDDETAARSVVTQEEGDGSSNVRRLGLLTSLGLLLLGLGLLIRYLVIYRLRPAAAAKAAAEAQAQPARDRTTGLGSWPLAGTGLGARPRARTQMPTHPPMAPPLPPADGPPLGPAAPPPVPVGGFTAARRAGNPDPAAPSGDHDDAGGWRLPG